MLVELVDMKSTHDPTKLLRRSTSYIVLLILAVFLSYRIGTMQPRAVTAASVGTAASASGLVSIDLDPNQQWWQVRVAALRHKQAQLAAPGRALMPGSSICPAQDPGA